MAAALSGRDGPPARADGERGWLDAGVRAAGRLGAHGAERKLGSLLGHVERRRGEYEQSRATPAVDPWPRRTAV